MLSVWPPALLPDELHDKFYDGRHILLRESMKKFDSYGDGNLEVCAYAASHRAYLNRQIILLLSCLGVKDEVFLSMQKDVADTLAKASTCPESAIQLLYNFTDESVPMTELEPTDCTHSATGAAFLMLNHGFSLQAEPLIRSVVSSAQQWVARQLKAKARIPVDKGAYVMGVPDETMELKYGEVFIQVRGQVIEGKVVVAKNPCLHPGDIRVLEAVNKSDILRECMNDVVVFPVRGRRPHPNEASGSDLDGDEYFVSWDERLLPPRENLTPLDYLKDPDEMVDQVTESHLANFLVDYLVNADLGTIANAHLALSDHLEEGPEDDRCKQLAALHAKAVDFQKTGVSAKLPDHLKPKKYPDFMEKPKDQTRCSERVLGVLYRKAKDLVETFQKEVVSMQQGLRPEPVCLLSYWGLSIGGDGGGGDFANRAQRLVRSYTVDVTRLMGRHGVEEVGDLVSGLLPDFSSTSKGKRRNRADERANLARDLRHLSRLHSRAFWKEFGQLKSLGEGERDSSHISIRQLMSIEFPGDKSALMRSILTGACICYQVSPASVQGGRTSAIDMV